MIWEQVLVIEASIIEQYGWPSWALRLLASLSVLVLITAGLDQMITFHQSTKQNDSKNNDKKVEIPVSFRIFQFQYLSVYLITMVADWLQGTNMYTLYSVSSIFCNFPSFY